MKKNMASLQYSPIAGILFGVAALWQFVSCVLQFSVWKLLLIVAYAAIAALFILKKRDNYVVFPFALLALLEFGTFILGFKYHKYVTWGYFFEKFNIYIMFMYLLIVVAYLVLLCIAIANFTSLLQGYKEIINSLWFVPAALIVAKIVLGVIGWLFSSIFKIGVSPYYITSEVFWNIFTAISLLPCALWIAYPDGLPEKENTFKADNTWNNTQTADAVATKNAAYCGLVKHILLLLFTCGIWQLIWIYRMTGYTNAVQNEEPRKPANKLLLCLFVPFYEIYWTYKTAQRVDKMAVAKGIPSDMATLCLILEFFVPIIPPILLQDKMNNIVTSNVVQPVTVQSEQKKDISASDTAEELKTYKELLDSGVITQEEFDAKKKQLLGL